MKICALSPFYSSSKAEILDFIRGAKFDLLVLPGVSKSGNTPSPHQIQRVLRPGMRVFVERKRGLKKATQDKQELKNKRGLKKAIVSPYIVTNKEIKEMPRQVFSRTPSAENMKKLMTNWQDRTLSLGSRRITFVLCGEINGFHPDGTVKHGRSLPYDIIANPVHTIMGRWNRLGRKLSELSRGSHMVLHVANNHRNHHRVKTNVRIYKKGKELTTARSSVGTLTWCECEV